MLNRRSFCTAAVGLAASNLVQSPSLAAESKERRVAVIGHTGRGNFGHGLDTVWLKINGAKIVGVADGNPAGLPKQLKRLGLSEKEAFTDYRAMLEKLRPDFVSVCPRHVDQHCDMTLAAIEAGVKGVYVEKPFVRTPAEADELVSACTKQGAKIAVAHRNRYHPVLKVIERFIADGKLGRLLEIRGRGKGDRRGGGEDLWVLGTHVMNLMHYFGGNPKSCSAVVLKAGKPITAADVGEGAEGLGLLAGDELHARYRMDRGVVAYFDSVANDDTKNAGFGLQLVGSEGIIDFSCDRTPLAYLVPGNPFQPTDKARPWVPINSAGVGKPETHPELIKSVYDHSAAVRDLIAACDEGREPLCNVTAGRTTVEMCTAVFESHRQSGKAVAFPLAERGNPLAKL